MRASYADQLACIRRELSMRKRIYPRWVADGKMTREKADREIELMEAAEMTIRAHAEQELLL